MLGPQLASTPAYNVLAMLPSTIDSPVVCACRARQAARHVRAILLLSDPEQKDQQNRETKRERSLVHGSGL
jgi:hypothetical protein